MRKGLRIIGQTLSIDMLRHCLVAFAEQYSTELGDDAPVDGEPPMNIPRRMLVDMIIMARDKAEEMIREEAGERAAGGVGGDGACDCPSHPYVSRDDDEVVLWKEVEWINPKVRV